MIAAKRMLVLERSVTDKGFGTSTRIEALRNPRLTNGDKVQ